MERKILKIDEIKIRTDLYPRSQFSEETTSQYAEAMRAGATFPKIIVARLKNIYILADGLHRIKAKKLNKETHISADIVDVNNEAEIYALAVKNNNSHGRPLRNEDRHRIICRLFELKFGLDEISELVIMPLDKIKTVVPTCIHINTKTTENIKNWRISNSELFGGGVNDDNREKLYSEMFGNLIDAIESGEIPKNLKSKAKKLMGSLTAYFEFEKNEW